MNTTPRRARRSKKCGAGSNPAQSTKRDVGSVNRDRRWSARIDLQSWAEEVEERRLIRRLSWDRRELDLLRRRPATVAVAERRAADPNRHRRASRKSSSAPSSLGCSGESRRDCRRGRSVHTCSSPRLTPRSARSECRQSQAQLMRAPILTALSVVAFLSVTATVQAGVAVAKVSASEACADIASSNRINRDPGPDILIGTAGRDRILGRGGDDIIRGSVAVTTCAAGQVTTPFYGRGGMRGTDALLWWPLLRSHPWRRGGRCRRRWSRCRLRCSPERAMTKWGGVEPRRRSGLPR